MTRTPPQGYLLSLAPDAIDVLRLSGLPDLEALAEEVQTLAPNDVTPPRLLATGSARPDVLSAVLSVDSLDRLRCRHGKALHVEHDPIYRHQAGPMATRDLPVPEVAATQDAPSLPRLFLRVTDASGTPLPHVRLHAEGTGLDKGITGVTDMRGLAQLPLPSENPAAVSRLSVLPCAGFWPRRLIRPVLRPTPPGAPPRINTIILRCLQSPFGTLPDPGLEAMGLEDAPLLTLPGTHPVRVAVLDPGAAPPPFAIERVESGALVEGWTRASASPSLAAALVAAAAPGVSLQVLQLGPRPRASDLIGAINWCLTAGIDLLGLGFATETPCAALSASLARARAQGLVVVAPGGDSGGAVLYPAAEPVVLSVGAWSGRRIAANHLPERTTGRVAEFSARGTALDLVAPGAGLVLPAACGPAAHDGTALSSALVTGFLARLLQTEPDLAQSPRTRSRAAALCAELFSRCHSMGLAPEACAFGLPVWDALRMTPESDCPVPAVFSRPRLSMGADQTA